MEGCEMMNFKDLSMVAAPFRGEGVVAVLLMGKA